MRVVTMLGEARISMQRLVAIVQCDSVFRKSLRVNGRWQSKEDREVRRLRLVVEATRRGRRKCFEEAERQTPRPKDPPI